MDALLESGVLVDVALGALAVELVVLLIWSRRGDARLRPLDVIGQLLAGGLLLVAVRNEATGGDHLVTLALLAASFPAHLFDLARRARSNRSG